MYATAFKKGYTPETVVFDLKTQFSTACDPSFLETSGNCYSPSNYDDKFRGPVSLRNALAQSLNIPAVKTLYLAGINESLKMASDLGITTLVNKDRYGLTLVLGGGEVKLVEMVGAYSVFANEGDRNETTSVLRIEDSTGTVIEEWKPTPRHVLDREIALQITDILSDNVARTPLYGANSTLYFPGVDVAAKTGTTNDYRDAWVIGYTRNLAVGAWAGNNNNTPMQKLAGMIVTPLWREFMDFAITKREPGIFAEPQATPDNLKPILRGIWFDPNSLVGDYDGDGITVDNAYANAHDILYFVDKDNPRGPSPSRPQNDPQFSYWEYPVSIWKSGRIQATTNLTNTQTDTNTNTDDSNGNDDEEDEDVVRDRRRNNDDD